MIKINDRFYINASINYYSLQEKTTVQDKASKNYGNEIYKDIGYYTTIEGCIKGLLKITTREFICKETKNNLQELIDFIQQETKYLKELKLDI